MHNKYLKLSHNDEKFPSTLFCYVYLHVYTFNTAAWYYVQFSDITGL